LIIKICTNGNERIRWKIEKRFGPQVENNEKMQGEEWIKQQHVIVSISLKKFPNNFKQLFAFPGMICQCHKRRLTYSTRTTNNSGLVFRVAGGWVLFKYRPQSKNAYFKHKKKFKFLLFILNLQIRIFHEKDSNFCGHVQVGDLISRRDGRDCRLSPVLVPCFDDVQRLKIWNELAFSFKFRESNLNQKES
jgi:hypothetical protein